MKTILIVEDNEKNMKLVRDILRHNGHATIEAHDRRRRRPPGERDESPT